MSKRPSIKALTGGGGGGGDAGSTQQVYPCVFSRQPAWHHEHTNHLSSPFFLPCSCSLSNLWIVSWLLRQENDSLVRPIWVTHPVGSSYRLINCHWRVVLHSSSLWNGQRVSVLWLKSTLVLLVDQVSGLPAVAYPRSCDSTKGNASWAELWWQCFSDNLRLWTCSLFICWFLNFQSLWTKAFIKFSKNIFPQKQNFKKS